MGRGMYYDKEKYVSLIMNSPLFGIDKERETTVYKRESYKMLGYLYCYLLAINERNYEPYGSEIMEVAMRCINSYDSSKGEFLYYFNSAWKQEYLHIIGRKINDERFRGIRITEEEKRNICKYLKLAEKMESSVSRAELFARVSKAMHIPIDKVELLAKMSSTVVTSDITVNEDGEEISIWEQVSEGTSIEQQFDMADSVDELLQTIEIAFDGLQDRQKAIVADMLTVRIWSIMEELLSSGKEYRFVSKDIVTGFERTGVMPTQRQIADKYNRDETSVSRSMKEFLKKLKNLHNKED